MMQFRNLSLAVLIALVALPGCRRKSAPPPPGPVADAPAQASTSAAAKPAASASPKDVNTPKEAVQDQLPTAPHDASLRNAVHKELTGAIHLYSMDNHRLPASFETLVKERYLKTMPKPPPGKRFALDRNRMQVVILD